VIKIIDLKSEVGKLPTLHGRRPETTEAERKASGAFLTLAPYRDGNVYSAKFSGDAAWERHPNGDELVHIVDGATTLHVMTDEGPQSYQLGAGMVAIVPQNTWHRFHAPDGVSIVTATPRPTEHLTIDVEDPRTLSDAERAANSEEKVR
jgi:mannose-6-phosphate isomerase-like protein (cupin superfamily)